MSHVHGSLTGSGDLPPVSRRPSGDRLLPRLAPVNEPGRRSPARPPLPARPPAVRPRRTRNLDRLLVVAPIAISGSTRSVRRSAFRVLTTTDGALELVLCFKRMQDRVHAHSSADASPRGSQWWIVSRNARADLRNASARKGHCVQSGQADESPLVGTRGMPRRAESGLGALRFAAGRVGPGA
jgi:hypothetical protein